MLCSIVFLSNLIFLLRYGWFSSDPKTFAAPSTFVASEPCSNSEGVQKGCSSYMENLYGKGEPIEITRNEFKTINISEGANVSAVDKVSMDVSFNPVVCWLNLSPFFFSLFISIRNAVDMTVY